MARENFIKEAASFLVGITTGIGLSALEEKFPTQKYETTSNLPLHFRALDLALEFVVMRFLKVISHHWHWQDIKYNQEFDEFGVFLNGADRGISSHIPLSGVIAHLGGRPLGYLLGADVSEFIIGFRNPDEERVRVCGLVQNKPVMFLSGPDKGCFAYAFDENGCPLPLKQLSELTHRNNMPRGIRVL